MQEAQITGVPATLTPIAAATVECDFSAASAFVIQFPAGNLTVNVRNLRQGQIGTIKYIQDGGGARSVTYGTFAANTGKQTVNTPTTASLVPAAAAGAITTYTFACLDSTGQTVDVISRLT